MAGLKKAKKYDWKDSNMALFGSDTDRDVKKASAETEPAWKNAGKKPGLQIWRINKFKVEPWPTTQYGQFFTGDSYIILNTYKDKESDKLLYDIHFWIGEKSTQDEYGTAAYKTVELDTLLDDIPVQHREVQAHESELFRSYFSTISYLKGGAASGFKHVETRVYKPRLFRVFKQGKITEATQVKVDRSKVTSDDCFVLENGLTIYDYRGKNANHFEAFKGAQFIKMLKDERPNAKLVIVQEGEDPEVEDEFNSVLDEAAKPGPDDDDDDDDDDDMQKQMKQEQEEKDRRRSPKLIRLSDADGSLDYSVVKEGEIVRKDFRSDDVFLLDHPTHGLFVWAGQRASKNEKANGLSYGHKYLSTTFHPCVPITVLTEKQESNAFKAAISA
ncbi:gelsolin-like protein 1 [Babylonia areolata]|uniref:gelsolin-like protein 1 n=1 Tax=Babylonia areolata TaxID=304850 RepID=UPI003FD11669